MKETRGNKHQQERAYWAGRFNLMYYQYVNFLVRALAKDAGSLIDVGSADAQYIETFDWIPERHTLDIDKPYSSENIVGIEMDFFDFETEDKYDFATCLQVLEHIPDAESFAKKLFQTADRVLISVPYLWERGRATYHVHDPVDRDKLLGWTGREPDYQVVVEEPLFDGSISKRLISYYHPEGEEFDPGKARQNVQRGPSSKQSSEQRSHEMIKTGRERNSKLEEKLKEREVELEESRKSYEKIVRERDRLNQLYAEIQQSRSWRYTLPIRKTLGALKGLTFRPGRE